MARLTAKQRNALPSSDFAVPSKRAYPINDASHAANAKSRASGKGVVGKVDAAVAKKYPGMGKSKGAKSKGKSGGRGKGR